MNPLAKAAAVVDAADTVGVTRAELAEALGVTESTAGLLARQMLAADPPLAYLTDLRLYSTAPF